MSIRSQILSPKVVIVLSLLLVIWLLVITFSLSTQSKKISDNTRNLDNKLSGICIGNTCVEDENILKMVNGSIPVSYTRGRSGGKTVRIRGPSRNVDKLVVDGYDHRNVCKATVANGYEDVSSYPYRTMSYDDDDDDTPTMGFGGGIFDMYIKPGIPPNNITDCPRRPFLQ